MNTILLSKPKRAIFFVIFLKGPCLAFRYKLVRDHRGAAIADYDFVSVLGVIYIFHNGV